MSRQQIFVASLAASVVLACTVRVNDPRLAIGGPESWHAGGRTYEIAGTYYKRGTGNSVWYVIVPRDTPANMTPLEVRIRALPLIRYAYEHRLHERAKIMPLRGNVSPTAGFSVEFMDAGSGKVTDSYEVPGGEVSWRLAHPDEP